MPRPGSYPLELYRGDTYRKRFRLNSKDSNGAPVPLDLTGWTGKAQIRPNYGGEILVEFTVTIEDQVESPGQFTIYATDEVTATLQAPSGVWDVQFTKAGEVRTMLAGTVSILPDVTRVA